MNPTLSKAMSLAAIPGVSGHEAAVREAILAMIGTSGESRVDPLGNLVVFKKGRAAPGKRIMLTAAMDEAGLIVSRIEEDGLLRFSTVGELSDRTLVGKAVEIGDGRLAGVIGTKAVHLQSEREREETPGIDKLFMDIGARNKADASACVSPGDRAVFQSPSWEIGEGKLMARAIGNRACCAILVSLCCLDLPYDCHFVFLAQSETGGAGASTAAYQVGPDVAIVLEAAASDVAEEASGGFSCRLGGGPVLSVADKGLVYNSALLRRAQASAGEAGIACQTTCGGNAIVARALQASGGGVQVLTVGLPCRYPQSPSSMVASSDVASLERLAALLANGTLF